MVDKIYWWSDFKIKFSKLKMASRGKPGLGKVDLVKLRFQGSLKEVKEAVEKMDEEVFNEKIGKNSGVFGYTPLHEAVARGNHEVLDYLLTKTKGAHVNCQANSGYTLLHLAASSGHSECVRVLLKHGADISIKDEYGKTPSETMALSSKRSLIALGRSHLRSEGKT